MMMCSVEQEAPRVRFPETPPLIHHKVLRSKEDISNVRSQEDRGSQIVKNYLSGHLLDRRAVSSRCLQLSEIPVFFFPETFIGITLHGIVEYVFVKIMYPASVPNLDRYNNWFKTTNHLFSISMESEEAFIQVIRPCKRIVKNAPLVFRSPGNL